MEEREVGSIQWALATAPSARRERENFIAGQVSKIVTVNVGAEDERV